MDALAREGMLFTHVYACGNRTVRGMEGCWPRSRRCPHSIVKRERSEHVATLARTLGAQATARFSSTAAAARSTACARSCCPTATSAYRAEGFRSPRLHTIWGVSDEDLVRRAVTELDGLAAQKKPFLGTLLTVSNHKPYTYPDGRIPDPPPPTRATTPSSTPTTRSASSSSWRKSAPGTTTRSSPSSPTTGPGLRQADDPIHSYEIPVLIVDPQKPRAQRLDMLGSSLDVGPTLLGLLGSRTPARSSPRSPAPRSPEHWVVMHHKPRHRFSAASGWW